MAPSKKPKKLPNKPPARKIFRIIGPKPVEEEEESTDSEPDFDPQSPRYLIDKNTNVGLQVEDDQNSIGGNASDELGQDVLDEDEEDEEDEEIQVPMKRKQVLKNAKKSSFDYILLYFCCHSPSFIEKTQRIESEDELSDITIEKEVPKISYTISTFSLEELKKPVTRRKPKSRLIDLSSELEWVDVKAHLKIAICNQLFPQDAVVEDDRFEMTWCIPRIVTNALSLHTVADYEQLVKKALKAKEPGVKILVDELPKIAPVSIVTFSFQNN